MDFSLTDEQQLIQRTAREFAHNVVRPRADENARRGHFDIDLARQIAEQGYLGAIIPREYGGAGLDYVTYGLVVEQIGAVDSAMRTVISVQTSLVCSAILRYGTEEQKRHYLPKLCSGEWLGCFGLTEPDTGSDAANQRTRATKVEGGWRINGAKMWISMGNHAKVALVFAQTDPVKKHRGLACFIVDTDQDGFQPSEIHGKMGLHGSDTAAISLDDCFASDEQVLGEVGEGFKVAMSALDSGRYQPTSMVDGSSPKEISGVPLNNFGNEDFGSLDLTTALTRSVNTVWAEVAEKLGRDTLTEYMERFGFTKDPPLDYPDEQMVPSGVRRGRPFDVGRVGIGQGELLATPMQMAMVAQAVGNGGERMVPQLVDRVIDADGRVDEDFDPEVAGRVMSRRAAGQLEEMMKNVVREGTGTAAALEGVEVAGKTGTAEIDIARNINDPWFIGFTDRYAVAVVVERVQGGQGGIVAAPVAKRVLEALGE